MTRNTICDGCDQLINVDTAHITFDHYIDEHTYSFTCRRCGHSNERPISAANIDKLIDKLIEQILR